LNFSLIYHYWNDSKDPEVWRDLANPVIASIATIRSMNVQTPIYVLDVSHKRNDWSYFPFKLKFEVVRASPHLGHNGKGFVSSTQMKLFSRSFDVPAFAYGLDYYAFCDSDIFWYRDMLPFPEPINGIYCNRKNNGFYYWNRGSEDAATFFRLWQEACVSGISDPNKRNEILTYYYTNVFNDAAAYCYVKALNWDLIKDLSVFDNWAGIRPDAEVMEHTKNIHLCQTNFGRRRGLMAIIIREFHERLMIHLDDSDLVRMFGERNMYMAKSFGLDHIHKARLLLNDRRKLYV
jgi:hypothetical protein